MTLSLWKITRVTVGAAKRVLLAQLRGVGANEGSDNDAESYDDAEMFFPMGLISRPSFSDSPSGLQGLVFDDGGDQVGVLAVINKLLATLSPALEEGETRLYGAKNQSVMVRLRADGSLEIKADANQPIKIDCTGTGNVIVNGGSAGVARSGDQVQVTFTPAEVTTMAMVAAGATPGTVTATNSVTITGTITGSGAAHFKA